MKLSARENRKDLFGGVVLFCVRLKVSNGTRAAMKIQVQGHGVEQLFVRGVNTKCIIKIETALHAQMNSSIHGKAMLRLTPKVTSHRLIDGKVICVRAE